MLGADHLRFAGAPSLSSGFRPVVWLGEAQTVPGTFMCPPPLSTHTHRSHKLVPSSSHTSPSEADQGPSAQMPFVACKWLLECTRGRGRSLIADAACYVSLSQRRRRPRQTATTECRVWMVAHTAVALEHSGSSAARRLRQQALPLRALVFARTPAEHSTPLRCTAHSGGAQLTGEIHL